MVSIAIDGPSGAGKSTLARRLAAQLGYLYVDTGAMYRAIGLYALRRGADPSDEAAIAGIHLALRWQDGAQHILINEEDVSAYIRTEEVSMAASRVAALPAVRAFLLETQRGLAKTDNIVMDGRDIGTVVLPDAQVKVFLTATPEARAKRRYAELIERGEQAEYAQVLEDVRRRDKNDSSRAAAPLRRAESAVTLNTTDLTLESSFEALCAIVRARVGEGA